MKNTNTILVLLAAALLVVGLCSMAVAQDKATAQEVVAKVKEAANTLSKSNDAAQFNHRPSPWVWKDTYVFVVDCDKKVFAANPFKPELVGEPITSLLDTKGHNVFPANFCEAARKSSGLWIEYWWPKPYWPPLKPSEKSDFHKFSYGLAAKGTPFVAVAGIYDDKATIAALSELTKTN
jgi:cytochrome c